MPSLIRFLIVILFLVGLGFAGMIGLIAYVDPTPKERTVNVSAAKLLGDD